MKRSERDSSFLRGLPVCAQIDQQRRYVYASSAYEALFGFTDGLAGRLVDDVLEAGSAQLFGQHFAQCMQGQARMWTETIQHIESTGGGPTGVAVTLTPVRHGGVVEGCVHTLAPAVTGQTPDGTRQTLTQLNATQIRRKRFARFFDDVAVRLAQRLTPDEQQLSNLLPQIAAAIAVERVTLWRHNNEGSLHCCAQFLASEGQLVTLADLERAAYPEYVRALCQDTITTADVLSDPRLQALHEDYFIPNGISSMLAVPFGHSMEDRGTWVFEHVGDNRVWQPEEIEFGRTMGGITAALLQDNEALEDDEQKTVTDEVLRSHKMEVVARLAGGIAHDFNNLLTVIMGEAEMGLLQAADNGAVQRAFTAIRNAGDRAATLTRQLLMFSRKRSAQFTSVDLCRLIDETRDLLRTQVPTAINIHSDIHSEPLTISADPSQIEQILLNLALNAADAMPNGGSINISLGPVSVAPATVAGSRHGWAHLVVSDTGVGMDEETQAHIFEPFFTTKGPGEGSGLGLSVIFGIVDLHGGVIQVQSTPGAGTTFEVFLPLSQPPAGVMPAPPAPSSGDTSAPPNGADAGQGQRILVVEDEDSVRHLTCAMLRKVGYRPEPAGDPATALEMIAHDGDHYDLVITDVMMPGITGPEMFERIRQRYPRMRGLFISGFAQSVQNLGQLNAVGTTYLQKPFTLRQLTDEVARLLAEG